MTLLIGTIPHLESLGKKPSEFLGHVVTVSTALIDHNEQLNEALVSHLMDYYDEKYAPLRKRGKPKKRLP
ncbi:MAG: hypothetical protein ACE5DI_02650 [Candidatus Micrarchaeia archaeon]